jgi:predicted CopG family antitoxin
MTTTIQIEDSTWEELNKRKKVGETFDEVINRALLEEPEVKRGKKHEK